MSQRIVYVFIWWCCSIGQVMAFESAVNTQLVFASQTLSSQQRLAQWQAFIASSQDDASDNERVRVVNDFINQADYLADKEQFSESDYWAAPWEFIASGKGDCEDFSIAKLFTLQAMGIPPERLRLMYVKVSGEKANHLVTVYYSGDGREPWVLDNLSRSVLLAGKRSDLQPVFSFNSQAVWVMSGWQRGMRSIHPLKSRKWQRVTRDWQEQLLALRN